MKGNVKPGNRNVEKDIKEINQGTIARGDKRERGRGEDKRMRSLSLRFLKQGVAVRDR
jgi:hypothetical protein